MPLLSQICNAIALLIWSLVGMPPRKSRPTYVLSKWTYGSNCEVPSGPILILLYCHPVHPRATAAVAAPDIQAIDIEPGLDCPIAEAGDDPKQVENVYVRR